MLRHIKLIFFQLVSNVPHITFWVHVHPVLLPDLKCLGSVAFEIS